jgi:eukaryotic-like serine/threonine-protein kinase
MPDGGDQTQTGFSTPDWELIKDLVFVCQSLSPADQAAHLRAHCPSERIRQEVLRLLQASSDCGSFMDKSATEKHLGVSLHQPQRIGRYRVVNDIGSGGSGIVYAAWDESLNRKVALKVLRPDLAATPELQKRLRWDARAASALQHSNIVVVYEVGSDAGVDYIAMECITGRTLSQMIKAGGLDVREVLHYAIQICCGLEAAHAAGVVHRDLKPGNIMITEQGVVKILDFGLAKRCDDGFDMADAPRTVEGQFAGTVSYVSPEQAEAKPVDARSDIFSFGAVLFEMLTGSRAFPGTSTLSILADILHHDPGMRHEPSLPMDPRFDELVRRCMRKDRERRFQSIAEVRVRLQELEERIQHPEPPAVVEEPPRRWPVGALAAGAVAIAALAAGLTYFILQPPAANFILTRVTADRGVTGYPAISRDASLLAYASDRAGNGNLDIWLQHLNDNDRHPLTTDPADDYEPTFSPDGSRLVFRSERNGGGLYSISTLGGNDERLLVAGGHSPQFSPDGKWIAYWTGRDGVALMAGSVKAYVIPAVGGEPEQFQPELEAAAFPKWSPDGSQILFWGRGTEHGSKQSKVDVWIAPFRGGPARPTGLWSYFQQHRLNGLPGDYRLDPSAWLRDRTLLFSAAHGDSRNVWGLKLGLEGTPSGEPIRLTAGTLTERHAVAAESAGRSYLAYEAMSSDTNVWRVALDGHGHARGEPELFVSGFTEIDAPSLSADGSRLVFSSKQQIQIGRLAIHLVEVDSNRRSIVANVSSKYFARPVISGDGRMVAYWAEKAGYVIPANGGVPKKICDHCGPPTHVSFDGKKVLFESIGDRDQILLASVGSLPKPLVDLNAPRFTMQSGGRFSPDGRWIVFAAGNATDAARQIFVAPLHPDRPVTQAELIPITEGDYPELEPYWAPDGKTIFFLSQRDGFQCIWARSMDQQARPQGPPYAVLHFHSAGHALGGSDAYVGNIGLSAGPKFLVFGLTETSSNIWLKNDSAH